MGEVYEARIAACSGGTQAASLALVWPETRASEAVLVVRTESGEPVGHVLVDRIQLERLLHGEPGEALLLERPGGGRMELRLVLENGERWLWLMGPGRLAFRAAALEAALDRAEAEREERISRRFQLRVFLGVAVLAVLLCALWLSWQLIRSRAA